MTSGKQGLAGSLTLPPQDLIIYASRLDGIVTVPESGRYALKMGLPGVGRRNRQWARVWIADREVIFQDVGVGASRNTVSLEKGRWPIRIEYCTNSGGGVIRLDATQKGVDTAVDVSDWFLDLEATAAAGGPGAGPGRPNDRVSARRRP